MLFLDPENDTKIVILNGYEAKTKFYVMAMLNLRYNEAIQVIPIKKWIAGAMNSMWTKFGAFVQNVHIHLKFGPKLPD